MQWIVACYMRYSLYITTSVEVCTMTLSIAHCRLQQMYCDTATLHTAGSPLVSSLHFPCSRSGSVPVPIPVLLDLDSRTDVLPNLALCLNLFIHHLIHGFQPSADTSGRGVIVYRLDGLDEFCISDSW